jgi:uncharacterized membrane protein
MTGRTRRSSVVFRHTALLDGVDKPLPAGAYIVETDEEQISGVSFVAYRRVQTTIIVPADTHSKAGRQVITIEPQALQAALDWDARA